MNLVGNLFDPSLKRVGKTPLHDGQCRVRLLLVAELAGRTQSHGVRGETARAAFDGAPVHLQRLLGPSQTQVGIAEGMSAAARIQFPEELEIVGDGILPSAERMILGRRSETFRLRQAVGMTIREGRVAIRHLLAGDVPVGDGQ